MDTKLPQVAQAMIDAMQTSVEMDRFIDSTDSHPGPTYGYDDGQCFTMTKDFGVKRGSSAAPGSQIRYTVIVKAEYIQFNDSEDDTMESGKR